MRAVPYLQREGVGVHVSADAVHLVEVVVWRGDVRVRRAASEPVGADGAGAALSRLADHAKTRGRLAHVCPDPSGARVRIVEVPDFGDADDVAAWLAEQEAALVAEHGGALVAASTRLTSGRDEQTAAVSAATTRDVDAVQAAVRAGGLVPLRIAPGLLVAATPALAFDATLADATIAVAHAEGGTLVRVSGGRVRSVETVAGTADEVADQAAASGGTVVVCGSGSDAVHRALREIYGADAARVVVLPDGVEPAQTAALGLALEAAGAWPEGVDLLGAELRTDAEVEREKQTAQRAILLVGVVLFGLLALTEAASAWLLSARADLEARTATRTISAATVDAARADVERLRVEVDGARRASVARSRAASTLEAVGRAVPEGAWLGAVAVDSVAVGVEGYATTFEGVQRFVAALEADPAFSAVRLLRTARVERSATLPRAVVAFDIEAVPS